LIQLLIKLKYTSKSIKWKKYAQKTTQNTHWYAKWNFKISFVKPWKVFVSYSAIFFTVQNKYAKATRPHPLAYKVLEG